MPNSRTDYKLYFLDILNSSQRIVRYTKTKIRSTFANDQKTIDAVIRNLEIIGEASGKIPLEIRKDFSSLPWESMVGMRNKTIHEYFDINVDVIWQTVKEDIPLLEKQVNKIIKQLDSKQLKLKT
jgi:hypothetical protein